MLSIKTVLFLTAFLRTMSNGNDIDLSEIKSQIAEEFPIPLDLGNVKFSLNDAKKMFREKCLKETGDNRAFKRVENGTREFMDCFTKIINTSAIQAEIDAARPIGELDTVFHKYCTKRIDVLACVEEFSYKIQPCMDEEEQNDTRILIRIVASTLNFACYKGGDQIALFIAEQGPECFKENKDALTSCINKTVSLYIEEEGLSSPENFLKFLMSPNQCREMNTLKDCIVEALSRCEESTPSNIVDSMFLFIRNETNCPAPVVSSQLSTSDKIIVSNKLILIIVYTLNSLRGGYRYYEMY